MSEFKDILNLCAKRAKERCLFKTERWLCDMLVSLEKNDVLDIDIDASRNDSRGSFSVSNFEDLPNYSHANTTYMDDVPAAEYPVICIAQTYFHQKNYTSALKHLQNCKSDLSKFLSRYALLLNFQRHKWETSIKSNGTFCFDTLDWNKTSNFSIRNYTSFSEEDDAYNIFITALINKELKDLEFVQEIILSCLRKDPYIWPAWYELSQLMVTSKDIKAISEVAPKCWMYHMFILEAYMRIGKPNSSYVNDALKTVKHLKLDKSLYFDMMLARIYYFRTDYNNAREVFKSIRNRNPAHTEHMDMYSNILFTLNDFCELTALVKDLFRYAKYTPETFFAAGNLYTLAAQHEKAASHFKQAIRLNPYYIDAWTLLGHEFIELKDVGSAIFSYRKAVELDENEYRAWYGLGMVNEVIKRKHHALTLYERALKLRPKDTRVLKAVAAISCKLGMNHKAEMILRRLYHIKEDDEDLILALANMIRDKNPDEATDLYIKFMNIVEEFGDDRDDDISYACMFVMQYYFSKKNFKMAELYSKKGLRLSFAQTTATYMLKQIDAEVKHRRNNDLPIPSRSAILPDFSIDVSDLINSPTPSSGGGITGFHHHTVRDYDEESSEMEFSELESSPK